MIYQLLVQQQTKQHQKQQTSTNTNNANLHMMSHRRQRKGRIIIGLFLFIVTYFMIYNHIMLRSIRNNAISTNNYSTITNMIIISNNNITKNNIDGIIDDNNNRTMIPSIAFLFLVDKPMNEEIWERWFNDADDSQMYSIFVHYGRNAVVITEEERNTTTSIIPHLGQFFCPYLIPSVKTEWYWLYDAQIQLLKYAYNDDPYATQFVYVSDTSIPLISFNEMYNRLIISTSNKSNNNNSSNDNENNDHNVRSMENTQKSKFCLTDKQEKIDRAWKNPSKNLNISMNNVKKGEMWTIITRPHVLILLEEKLTLDIWNNTFYSTWIEKNKTHVGAPDETLFPTMLHIKGQYIDQNCTNERKSQCCSTMIPWNEPNTGPVSVYDYDTKQNVILSDICEGNRSPCTFITLLDEYGLIALQKAGYFFLRKVKATPSSYDNKTSIVVRTKYNETISLNDALIQLHQNQPMMMNNNSISSTRKMMISNNNDVDNNKDDNFQCIVPQ